MPSCEEMDYAPGQDTVRLRLLKTRTVLIGGPVDEELAETVIAELLVLDAESHDPIRVIIATPGGSVDVGFAIHDMLRYVESEIFTIGAGQVASMGIPLLLAAEKARRFALPNTRFMIHQPLGGIGGYAKDIRIAAQEILKTRAHLNELIAQETGQPIEKVNADSDRDYWLGTQEAVAYGLVSKVIRKAKEVG